MSSGEAPTARARSPIIRVFDCHIARPTVGDSYEYLLLQRSSHKVYAGSWRMVGGKVRSDEAVWQACLREVSEETQLPVLRLLTVPYINRFYEWQDDRINDIPVFVAVTSQGAKPVLDAEHCAAEWLSIAEALPRMPWPGQREGLQAADLLLRTGLALHAFMEITLDP